MTSSFDRDPQFSFLMQILQATADGDSQILYQLLRDNQDKLDNKFVTILREWAQTTLLDLEQGLKIAPIIGNFSSLISQFQQGNSGINQEIAIVGYEAIEQVFTRDVLPKYWAMNQVNLGNAYYSRILEDRAENLEKAIRYYEAALEVYIRSDFPQQWASIKNNLADAYRNRIRGEKAENLELAIRCGKLALEVRTPDFPEEWAATQNNLGLAYWERIWGEKSENLEQAITFYQAALKVRRRKDDPQKWADTQNNLGLVYVERIRGKQEDNLESAIHCYQEALKIFTFEAFPFNWAKTQNNLGNVYYRFQKNRAENLDQAINCYEEALRVYTDEMPEQWAMVQNNLGEAYRNRIYEDKAENLEKAIAFFSAALKIYTRAAFPKNWALVLNGLGICYLNRLHGKRKENLYIAIEHLSKSLEIHTHETFPRDYVVTQFNLGVAYQDAQLLPEALDAFVAAINTVEFLRSEIVSGVGREIDKTKLAESWNDLYRRTVEICLQLGHNDKALEYVEFSKTRNLVELIFSRDFDSLFPSQVTTQLQQLQQDIASNQNRLQTGTVEDPTTLVQELQQLRQEQKKLQDKYFPIGAGFKLESFKQTLEKNTTIVQWYFTSEGFKTFIITRDSTQPIVLSYDAMAMEDLEKWAKAYLRLYNRRNSQKKQSHWWQIQLQSRLQKLAEILRVDDILTKLPQNCDELILVPHQALHLFPLHALPVREQSYLLDCFSKGIRYAPSCQLLQLAQMRQRPNLTRLFAVQDPTNDLSYTNVEMTVIKRYFEMADVLKQAAATKATFQQSSLKESHCIHFSCHGYFDLENPLESALKLADAPLTLGEILQLNLEQCRLVTLSACETGFIDFTSLSDEYIGLPNGFLYAGSPSVVSSLWNVNDLSTAFLMIRFYQNLHEGLSVAISLNQAQIWLRNVTKIQLEEWIAKHQLKLDLTLRMRLRRLDFEPFKSPFYWAAFFAIGQR
jgi:CHAT domain-containing protein